MILPGDEEGRLVAAARRGDRRAFDTLVGRHGALLRGYLRRRVGPDAAEDVWQETWVAAWASFPRYERRARFKAWLMSIALNKVQDHHRTRARTPTQPLDDEAQAAGVDPYEAVDLRHAVRAALSGLPDSQREVLELYYYAELTLPEVAGVLGRNLNTVKYQFYRAHALVAEAWEEPPR